MKKTIPVIGMACVVCAANVENTLRKLRGVNSATVTLSTRTVLVDYDPDVITLDDMKREVSNAGYDLVVESDRNAEEINRREYTLLRRRTLLSWLFAALTMYFGMSGDGALCAPNRLAEERIERAEEERYERAQRHERVHVRRAMRYLFCRRHIEASAAVEHV